MIGINKPEIIDIRALRWGGAPVALLPKALRDLWKEESLPGWIVAECNLPENSTVAALGPEFWKSQPQIYPRVQHFVEFLVKTRVRNIESIRCINQPWPVGLELTDIPFSARGANALKTAAQFANKETFPEATFGELLRIPNLGVKSLLEITTLVDAALELHGRMTADLAKSFATQVENEMNSDRTLLQGIQTYSLHPNDSKPINERWSAELAAALREPWVDQIDEYDIRFRRLLPPGHGTVEERIERVISDPASASVELAGLVDSLPRIRAAVEGVNSQPLEDTLLNFLALYVGAEQPRLNAIAARFGWLGDDPKTLQECGDALGLTRERIRQIEARFLKKIANRPIYLPRLDAGLAALEASAPLPFAQAAQLLVDKDISRQPFSPLSLVSTARLLGRKTTLSVQTHKGERLVVSEAQGALLGILARTARKLTGQSGVASVYQVVDVLQERINPNGLPDIDEDDVRTILRSQGGCEFLDDDWFWFTALPEGRNRLENVTKKILSVASPQSISSIREGVRRTFQWRASTNARYRSITVPPQAVLARFLERHPDFHLNGEWVTSVKPLDYRKLLGEGEQILVNVLRGISSGVVDRRTLIEECLSRGINENTLAIYTTYSPILEHIGTGLWQLRGVRVDPAAVEAVREQNALRSRETRVQDFGWSPDGKLWVAWKLPRLTGSPVFTVPGAVKRYVAGRSFVAKPKEIDRAVGKIGVTDDGMSYGYAPFLRYIGADEGDLLLAEFDLAPGEVRLSIDDDGVLDNP